MAAADGCPCRRPSGARGARSRRRAPAGAPSDVVAVDRRRAVHGRASSRRPRARGCSSSAPSSTRPSARSSTTRSPRRLLEREAAARQGDRATSSSSRRSGQGRAGDGGGAEGVLRAEQVPRFGPMHGSGGPQADRGRPPPAAHGRSARPSSSTRCAPRRACASSSSPPRLAVTPAGRSRARARGRARHDRRVLRLPVPVLLARDRAPSRRSRRPTRGRSGSSTATSRSCRSIRTPPARRRPAACANEQGKFWAHARRAVRAPGQAGGRGPQEERGRRSGSTPPPSTSAWIPAATPRSGSKDTAEAERYGVTSTPAFFINGRLVVGAQPYETLRARDRRGAGAARAPAARARTPSSVGHGAGQEERPAAQGARCRAPPRARARPRSRAERRRSRHSSWRPPAAANTPAHSSHQVSARRASGSTTRTRTPRAGASRRRDQQARAGAGVQLVDGERGHDRRRRRRAARAAAASPFARCRAGAGGPASTAPPRPPSRCGRCPPRAAPVSQRPGRAGRARAAAEVDDGAQRPRRSGVQRPHDGAHEQEMRGPVVEGEGGALARPSRAAPPAIFSRRST